MSPRLACLAAWGPAFGIVPCISHVGASLVRRLCYTGEPTVRPREKLRCKSDRRLKNWDSKMASPHAVGEDPALDALSPGKGRSNACVNWGGGSAISGIYAETVKMVRGRSFSDSSEVLPGHLPLRRPAECLLKLAAGWSAGAPHARHSRERPAKGPENFRRLGGKVAPPDFFSFRKLPVLRVGSLPNDASLV